MGEFIAVALAAICVPTISLMLAGLLEPRDILDFFRRFKPKSRTERKLLREIRKIEKEIYNQKRLEALYERKNKALELLEEERRW